MSNREYWKQELVGRMESLSDEEIKELQLDKLTPEDTDNLADMVMSDGSLWAKIEDNLLDIIKTYCYNKIELQNEQEKPVATKDEQKIADIIKEAWDNELWDGDRPEEIEIYASYIMTYGYSISEIVAFTEKYGIVYDPELSDPEDADDIYGSLIINEDSIAAIPSTENQNTNS